MLNLKRFAVPTAILALCSCATPQIERPNQQKPPSQVDSAIQADQRLVDLVTEADKRMRALDEEEKQLPRDDQAQRVSDDVVDAQTAITIFAADPKLGCATVAFWNARLALEKIQSDYYPPQPRLSLSLSFADAAMQKQCFTIADKQYREIIQVFVGLAYSAYRERALLGIQDVKEARAAGKADRSQK